MHTLPDPLPDPRWQAALELSRYLKQTLSARPQLIPELAASWLHPLSDDLLLAPLRRHFNDDNEVKSALRCVRQRAMAHIALRDLCGLAPLSEVIESMTLLADLTTNFALDYYHRQLVETHGEPLDRNGRPQRLLVIGMGKLGGRELNVSVRCRLHLRLPGRRRHHRRRGPPQHREFRLLHPPRQARNPGARRPHRRRPGFPRRHAPASQRRLRAAGLLARFAGELLRQPGPRVGTLCLDQGTGDERRRQCRRRRARRVDGGPAADLAPLRLPQVPRFRRDQRDARPARADPARSRAQGQGRPHQARPRRDPRNRVHGPGFPADPGRPRPRPADPPDPVGAAAPGRAPVDPGRNRAGTARRLRLPAPAGTPPAIRRGQADPHAAGRCRRPRTDRAQHGLCRLGGPAGRTQRPPRPGQPAFRVGLLRPRGRRTSADRRLARPVRRRRGH